MISTLAVPGELHMASKIDTQVGTQNRLTHGARPVIKRVGRRGDISFSVVLDLGRDPQSGKRIRRWHSGYRTKRDAERARTELLHGLDRGTYVEPTTMTTGEFLQRWLDATKTNVAVRTHVRYTEICRRWMREFGHVPLRNLRPEQILAVRSKWETGPAHRGKALSPQSVLHQHRVLYSALDRAVRWGMLASNPCSRVDPHTCHDIKLRRWTHAKHAHCLPSVTTTPSTGLSWRLPC